MSARAAALLTWLVDQISVRWMTMCTFSQSSRSDNAREVNWGWTAGGPGCGANRAQEWVVEFRGFWESDDGSSAGEDGAADAVGGCNGTGGTGRGSDGRGVGSVLSVCAAYYGGSND